MNPKDELIHAYPKNLDTPWKENWYFNFIDRKNNAWGINHISLLRHTNKGRFTAIHVVDEEIIPYSNVIDIEDLAETTDGALTFEFIEPFKKFRVTFDGPRHQVKIDYDALFPAFDYGKRDESDGNKALSIDHYRQALVARGTLTKDGATRPIECVCDRDHTWGYRDEGMLTGWNWVGAYFPARTVNFNRILVGEHAFAAGYVSTAEGNTRVSRLEVEDTQFVNEAPVSAVYTGYDREGRILARLKTDMFSRLCLPMQDKENMLIYEPEVPSNRSITVFTDISCGYCRRLHGEINTLLDEGVRVRYLLFPRAGLGSQGHKDLESVWCADDPQAAMTNAKSGGKIDPKSCDTPIESHVALAERLGLRGTPLIYTDSGVKIPGYREAAILAGMVNDSKPLAN